jgi:hypothetical protein
MSCYRALDLAAAMMGPEVFSNTQNSQFYPLNQQVKPFCLQESENHNFRQLVLQAISSVLFVTKNGRQHIIHIFDKLIPNNTGVDAFLRFASMSKFIFKHFPCIF